MSAIPLVIGLVLGAAVFAGYVLVLVGMHQEDRRMRLAATPPSRAAGLARRVTGCHVRGESITYGRPASARPSRVVPATRTVMRISASSSEAGGAGEASSRTNTPCPAGR
ncbi:hypothetical protein HS041_00950 [Planomonospora sp. ID67723]|uniref:hypothetical protein n=1 Tax=Planomonospora sp. ID67723 TaxID=2738134 RepID=UPI0018C3CA76|nr:hypothetical protein [Planomonospora sp. ID67723]MBG0826350.1 hypothetical protein [Planomonospora sp. ID67723]